MNRYITCFLLLPLLSFSQQFNAGPIIGFNTSQVSGDNLSGFNKIGIRCGGFVNYNIQTFDIQIELQYTNKGSREKIKENMYEEGYRFKVNYIEMPLLIKKAIYNKTKIETGLQIGHLLNWQETCNSIDCSGLDVKKMEYSIIIGLTRMITSKIYLNSRLCNSIAPIRAHFSGQSNNVSSKGQYNTSISFSLYYYLAKQD
tara:strand:+ start:823 stop:1422 length:600 start_codon:yes stop_codon:yes gene_type:complete